jgi:hypothetical protein
MRPWTSMAVVLALGVGPVGAGGHGHSGGGGSHSSSHGHGGGSRSSGGGHARARGGGSHASTHAGESHGSSAHRTREGGATRPPLTDAQRRHPRPGTGTGDRFDGRFFTRPYSSFGYRYGYFGRYRYSNLYFDPFFFFDYGYSPSYYGGYYGGYSAYPAPRYRYAEGAVRVIVDPPQTQVYVDGDYAGIADDFDGIFQRLHVPPGEHEITLSLDGYQTEHFRVFVPVGRTLKIHHVMIPGRGEHTEDRYSDDREAYRNDRRGDDAGLLLLDVRPNDAAVYVDDEFRGSGSEVARLRLGPGRHRIEVVRAAYRTVEREVEIRAGQRESLRVELPPF